MTFSTVLKGALALFMGESAAERIKRKQNEIAEIATRNGKQIAAAIDEEIDVIRHSAAVGFKKIDDLVATGALTGVKATSLQTARKSVEQALKQLDVALA